MELLRAPLSIGLAINSICDLDCKYCYAQPFTLISMMTENALTIVQDAAEMGVFKIAIEGGEPLIHKGLFIILDYALSQGLEVDLLSNGTQIDDEKIKRMQDLATRFEKWTGIQISLDSTDPMVNDSTRGKGKLVMDNINKLLERGVPVSLGTVVTHKNVVELEDIVNTYYAPINRQAIWPGVRSYHFIKAMPTWKSLKNYEELALTKDDFLALKKTREYFDKLMKADNTLEITLLSDKDDFPDADESASMPCAAGYKQLIIRSDMLVATCDLSLNVIIGDLTKQTLKEVWDGIALREVKAMDVLPCVLALGRTEPYNITETPNKRNLSMLRREAVERLSAMNNRIKGC